MYGIGHDTEYFIVRKGTKEIVYPHTLGIPLQKNARRETWSSARLYRDGCAVELGSGPFVCRSSLWETQGGAIFDLKQKGIKSITFDSNLHELTTDPVIAVDLKEIAAGPPDLRQFGCSPTYCAYNRSEKVPAADPMETPFRTSGAHLHYGLGYTDPGFETLGLYAKYCDLLIGLPLSIIYGDDLEYQRRTLYGQAGEFRKQRYGGNEWTKPEYGFEYRVCSSRLYNHPGIFGLFSAIFKYLLTRLRKMESDPVWNEKLDVPLSRAINTGVGATELLQEFSDYMTKWETLKEDTGMNGLGYIPKDWGAAILKLREMRQKPDSSLSRFLLGEGQVQAHWGWSECNDHKSRSSTVGHKLLVQEESWKL